jgi:phosphoribosylformylglycinamidine synthase
MYHVKVYITYKESILDPQGEAIKTALHRLDYQNVQKVTVGKYFELTLTATQQPIEQQVDQMCRELLANINMESFRYEIEPIVAKVED